MDYLLRSPSLIVSLCPLFYFTFPQITLARFAFPLHVLGRRRVHKVLPGWCDVHCCASLASPTQSTWADGKTERCQLLRSTCRLEKTQLCLLCLLMMVLPRVKGVDEGRMGLGSRESRGQPSLSHPPVGLPYTWTSRTTGLDWNFSSLPDEAAGDPEFLH